MNFSAEGTETRAFCVVKACFGRQVALIPLGNNAARRQSQICHCEADFGKMSNLQNFASTYASQNWAIRKL